VYAVHDLTLDLRDGEIFGFIGPNGAGKTTTIKMLTGITPPDSGTITFDGNDVVRQSIAYKRKLGFVPDANDLFDRLTGHEYLNFIADMYGVPTNDRRKRMDTYFELFEIGDAAGQYLNGLSHGTKQKLTIIGSLLHEPRLWVLDEPLTSLDTVSVRRLQDEMRRLRDEGRTVFFTSHVMPIVGELCDRVGLIVGGKLLSAGSPGDVFAAMDRCRDSLDGGDEPFAPAGDGHA
jgi:ABC-2 type transport system ATP-binding protein